MSSCGRREGRKRRPPKRSCGAPSSQRMLAWSSTCCPPPLPPLSPPPPPPAAAATVAPTSATVTAAAAAQAAEPLGRAGGLGLEPGNVGGGDRAAEASVAAGHAGLVEPLSEQGAGAALRPLIAVERVELGRLEGALPDGLELVEALSWPKASMDPACRRAARTCSCTSRSALRASPGSSRSSPIATSSRSRCVRRSYMYEREGRRVHTSRWFAAPSLRCSSACTVSPAAAPVRGPLLQPALPLEGVVAVVRAG